MSNNSESSPRKSISLGISVLFEMNNELIIDNVDKMYNKLGPYNFSKKVRNSARHEYVILEGGYYNGYTTESIPEGFGCLLLNTGQIYEGAFKKGQIRGNGRMIDLDGTAYEGYWKRNDIRGEGKITWLDDKVYEGKIRKIKPHGFGILNFPDGSSYRGKFVRGSMHGNGVLFWKTGKIYAGEWRKSEMNGFGAMHWVDKYYFGNFKAGEISGIGKMEWNDGKTYIGEWLNGLRNGIGYLFDRKQKQGIWENDSLVQEENLESSKLESLNGILDEKVKELKTDENLEKFLQFEAFITKGYEPSEVLSEFRNSFAQSYQDKEISWSDQEENIEENILDDIENSVHGSEFKIHVPELHISDSRIADSELDYNDISGLRRDSPEIQHEISLPKIKLETAKKERAKLEKSPDSYEIEIKIPKIELNDSQESVNVNQPVIAQDEPLQDSHAPLKLPDIQLDVSGNYEIPSSDLTDRNSIPQPFLQKEIVVDNSIQYEIPSSNQSILSRHLHEREKPDPRDSSDEINLPALKLMKEFTIEPTLTSAPVLIHNPQIAVPKNPYVQSDHLDKIDEMSEASHSKHLDQTIETEFEEESELEICIKEYEVPDNIDFSAVIRSKDLHDKDEPLFKGRLEKVLVVDQQGRPPRIKSSILQNRPEGSLDYFVSPNRDRLDKSQSRLMPFSEVILKLESISIPLSGENYKNLFEIRELIGPFDYSDPDGQKIGEKALFVDWQDDEELKYIGQVDANGDRQGAGIEVMPTGLYEGYWKRNARHGLGRVITLDGDNFEGFWQKDYKRGFGALWKYIGEGYVGDWDFDTPEGLGTEISGMEIYEGSFHYGLRHGKGVLQQANLKYTGEFHEGSINGYGVIQWNNGSVYAGIFINGEIKGMKGAFIPAYKKTVYKRREIRKVDLKQMEKVSETEESEEIEETKNSEMKETGESGLKVIPMFRSELDNDSSQQDYEKENELVNEIEEIAQKNSATPAKNNEVLSSRSSILSNSPLTGHFKLIANKPEENKSLSLHSNDNSRLNDSQASERKILFPEATKGIMRPPGETPEGNQVKPLVFTDDVQEYSDEELHRRKAKFKAANKEKGVENILKKDKKKK